jgi:hypothetical protein
VYKKQLKFFRMRHFPFSFSGCNLVFLFVFSEPRAWSVSSSRLENIRVLYILYIHYYYYYYSRSGSRPGGAMALAATAIITEYPGSATAASRNIDDLQFLDIKKPSRHGRHRLDI